MVRQITGNGKLVAYSPELFTAVLGHLGKIADVAMACGVTSTSIYNLRDGKGGDQLKLKLVNAAIRLLPEHTLAKFYVEVSEEFEEVVMPDENRQVQFPRLEYIGQLRQLPPPAPRQQVIPAPSQQRKLSQLLYDMAEQLINQSNELLTMAAQAEQLENEIGNTKVRIAHIKDMLNNLEEE